jgi:hypothetical protein
MIKEFRDWGSIFIPNLSFPPLPVQGQALVEIQKCFVEKAGCPPTRA